MKSAELCAGYGGLALAVEAVFGAETAWVSEFEAAPSKVLARHWPDVPNHGDMTEIDWDRVEPVDIIAGGTPCQDLSGAGKRAGMTEGTRSNLWVSMREAIATIQPKYVVWENVRGAYSATATSDLESIEGHMGSAGSAGPVLRALGRVLGDLSSLGYDAEWRGVRASDIGAPHQRFRVFVLATRRTTEGTLRVGSGGRATLPSGSGGAGADATPDGADQRPMPPRPAPTVAAYIGHERPRHAWNWRPGPTDSSHNPAERRNVDWGDYGQAIRRWESLHGPAPAPTAPPGRGRRHRLNPVFVEWMMGLPAGWVTGGDATRNEQLRMLGNGVVPQQAIAALQDMKGTS